MPGLMATRAEYGPIQPLANCRVAGSLHMTIQVGLREVVIPAYKFDALLKLP